MKNFKPVPQTPKDITANWLHAILPDEHFKKDQFAGLSSRRIGADFGFASEIFLFKWLVDNDDDDDNEESIVIKLFPFRHKRDEHELAFYRSFSTVGVRIPRFYYGAIDAQSQRAVIVLEAISGAKQGDVLKDLTSAEAQEMVKGLARMHARWAGRTDFPNWMPPLGAWDRPAEWLDSRRARLIERFGDEIPPSVSTLLAQVEKLPSIYNGLIENQNRPAGLIHGDFHLDNILFEENDRPIILDWSRPLVGPSVINLADFLFEMLPREGIEVALSSYLEEIVRLGAPWETEEALLDQLWGAFARLFIIRTCGVAMWEPDFVRGDGIIRNGFHKMEGAIDFWKDRGGGRFSF